MVNFLHFTRPSDNFYVKIKPQLMADMAATMCSSHCRIFQDVNHLRCHHIFLTPVGRGHRVCQDFGSNGCISACISVVTCSEANAYDQIRNGQTKTRGTSLNVRPSFCPGQQQALLGHKQRPRCPSFGTTP